jgi:AcrR family transcriptional regulator
MPKVSREHMENRRRQILDAANRCFARVGFHNATMQDVIREAGLSAGAIYNYFSSKEDIIAAIAHERHAREAEASRAAEDDVNAHAALMQLARAFFGRLASPGEEEERRVGVQLWAEALNNKRLLKVVLQGTAEPRRVLAGLIGRLKSSGDISCEMNSDALARLLIALFQGLVLQKCWEKDLNIGPCMDAVLWLAERTFGAPGIPSHGPAEEKAAARRRRVVSLRKGGRAARTSLVKRSSRNGR